MLTFWLMYKPFLHAGPPMMYLQNDLESNVTSRWYQTYLKRYRIFINHSKFQSRMFNFKNNIQTLPNIQHKNASPEKAKFCRCTLLHAGIDLCHMTTTRFKTQATQSFVQLIIHDDNNINTDKKVYIKTVPLSWLYFRGVTFLHNHNIASRIFWNIWICLTEQKWAEQQYQ